MSTHLKIVKSLQYKNHQGQDTHKSDSKIILYFMMNGKVWPELNTL